MLGFSKLSIAFLSWQDQAGRGSGYKNASRNYKVLSHHQEDKNQIKTKTQTETSENGFRVYVDQTLIWARWEIKMIQPSGEQPDGSQQ